MTHYMLEELEELFGSKPSTQRSRKARMKIAWANLIRQYRLSLHECTQSFSVGPLSSLGYCIVLIPAHYAQPVFNSLQRISFLGCFVGASHFFIFSLSFRSHQTDSASTTCGHQQSGCEQIFVLFSASVTKLEPNSHAPITCEVSFSRRA